MIRIDAHVVLSSSSCKEQIRALEAYRVRLVIAESGGSCRSFLLEAFLAGKLRFLIATRRGEKCVEPCITVDGFTRPPPEILYVSLSSDSPSQVREYLKRYPNRVLGMVVDLAEIRDLFHSNSLDYRRIRALYFLGLRYHAPLLVGSGARSPAEIVGYRPLASVLRLIDPEAYNKKDYRKLLGYLYQKAAIAELEENEAR